MRSIRRLAKLLESDIVHGVGCAALRVLPSAIFFYGDSVEGVVRAQEVLARFWWCATDSWSHTH